jgi:hypothetical protein
LYNQSVCGDNLSVIYADINDELVKEIRIQIAIEGGKRGALSRFVEDALRRELTWRKK